MQTHIEFDPAFSLLTAVLEPGEAIKAETGAMVAQQGVQMSTSTGAGGIMGGIRRAITKESFFLNTFTAGPGGGWVSFAPPSPGSITALDIHPEAPIYIQPGSFLAATVNVIPDSQFQGLKAMFSNEGAFFIKATVEDRPGTTYCNSYGAIKKIPVTPEQELTVDNGHLVAFTNGVEYSIGKSGGVRSLISGGEGLVIKIRGNGHAWIQTRNLQNFADCLTPLLPKMARRG